MKINKSLRLVGVGLILSLGMLGLANGASINVKCETRGTSRSKVSIDGAGLTGTFYAIAYSGTTAVKSKAPMTADASHEVGFDFDSDPANIAAGATKISATFIKSNTVYGYIRRKSDNLLVGAMKATCVSK